MKVNSVLLLLALSCCCSAQNGDHHDNPSSSMMTGAAKLPAISDFELNGPKQDTDQALWRGEVLDQLKLLVSVQKEVAKGQGQVVQLLGTLGTQGSQQMQDLKNLARHQTLLVESHQALLLQTSRIANQLQEVSKKCLAPAEVAAPNK